MVTGKIKTDGQVFGKIGVITKKKVARSSFYEWLSPWRITVLDSKGVPLGGRSHEGFLGIPKEKEAAFYVNYDNSTGKFKGPEDAIELIDVFNRASSFLSHYTTASLTRKALDDGDREWNYKAFSEIPIRIMSVFTRQEEMPAVLNEFRSRSTKHKHLVETLSEHYSAGADFMKSIKMDVVPQGA